MNWLIKEEPGSYSFDQLTADGGACWSGVRNPLAQRHLKAIRKGDRILYYHTGTVRAIVGLCRAKTSAFQDPADRTGRYAAVDIVPVRALPRPVTLAELKTNKRFASHPLVRISRLSVMPISDAELREIERLAGSKARSRRAVK